MRLLGIEPNGSMRLMFGRWLRGEAEAVRQSGADALHASVARHLPGADAETVTVVTSMAGLLGAVAYADRDYSQASRSVWSRRIRSGRLPNRSA